MSRYYLGIDIGGSKSHALIVDERGEILGFGKGGTGNHESVGYDGLSAMMNAITDEALSQAGLTRDLIAGAGFGLCGYDWESERQAHLDAVATLGLNAPVEIVNDAVIGLIAGAHNGWGVCVVAGTSCNCWGRDAQGRQGHVLGFGSTFGEAGGGNELVQRAIVAIAQAYTKIGDPTTLTDLFVQRAGVADVETLLEAYSDGQRLFKASDASLVFQAAEAGDQVAQALVETIGTDLGKLAIAVIRQLELQDQTFDVILAGNFYRGSPVIAEMLTKRVLEEAPHAQILRLHTDPVVGGVLLGMEVAGCDPAMIAQTRTKLTGQAISNISRVDR